MQPNNFFSTDATPWHPNSPPRPGEAPHPAPSARKSATQTAQKTALCAPWEHPGGFGIRKSASNSGHSPLRGLGVGLGVGLGDDRGTDRPVAALHFLLPTGDSRSGRRSFDSKHLPSPARRGSRSRPPLRRPRPCDSKGSECQCGIHTAEAASALRSRKTERAAKEKPTPISQIFFSTCRALAPQRAATPWGGSPPRPLCQKICYSDCTENCPLRPLGAPRRFGIRKSASNSGHSPLRGSGGCSMHCSMHYSMHYSMHCSMQCSTHCRPSLFAAHRR